MDRVCCFLVFNRIAIVVCLEIVNKDPNLFQSNLKYTEQIKFHTFNTIISSYPVKSTFEDFYLNSNFLKKSLTMSKCSQQNRELTSNF